MLDGLYWDPVSGGYRYLDGEKHILLNLNKTLGFRPQGSGNILYLVLDGILFPPDRIGVQSGGNFELWLLLKEEVAVVVKKTFLQLHIVCQ